MADELDTRLEASLRAALHHEADGLPLLIRSDDIERARRRRGGRRLALPASLLGLAAVLAILVATGVIGRTDLGTVAGSPSATAAASQRPLASYADLRALVGVEAVNELRDEHPDEEPGGPAISKVLGTVDPSEVPHYAVHCMGGSIDLVAKVKGTELGTMRIDCNVRPFDGTMLLSSFGEASTDRVSLSVTSAPEVRWRIVVAGFPPTPSPTPFTLATYEELEASLAENSIMPVVLRGEHPVAEAGTGPIRTVVGKVGDVYFEDFAYSCTGGSITINKVAGDQVLTGFGTECGDNVEIFKDGTGSVDPDAEIVVTASPQVVWRVVVSAAPMPSPQPTEPVVTGTPSLPPAGAGETSLLTLDVTAADGQVTRTVNRPADTDEYRLHADCSGSGTIELNVDGVDGFWTCGSIGLEVFAPNQETNSAELVATATGEARFLLRLDAVDRTALPGVTFRPPMLTLRGPAAMAGFQDSFAAFPGCGLTWEPETGGGFADSCGPSWQPVPNKLVQRPGTSVEVLIADGWTITRIDGAMARDNAILMTGRAPDEQQWIATSSDGQWSLKVPPLGFWGLRLLVTATKDGDTFQVPYYGAIYVMH